MKYKFKKGDRVHFVGPLGRVYCGEIVHEWPDRVSYTVREGGINHRMYGSSLTLADPKEELEVKRPFTVQIEEKEVVQTVKVKTVHLKLTEDEFKVIMRALNAHPQSAVSDLWDRLDDFANDNGIIDDESEF